VESPSPRKAWIETERSAAMRCSIASPSPRKAWIETPVDYIAEKQRVVAFPPEGVD